MDAIGLRWWHAAIRTSIRRSSWMRSLASCSFCSSCARRQSRPALRRRRHVPRPQRRAEFAVTGEEMEHIVVPGHVQCGGIGALVKGNYRGASGASFVHAWMNIVREARSCMQRCRAGLVEDPGALLRVRGHRRVAVQFHDLPRIARVGQLRLHGWYFDPEQGSLLRLDP